MNFVQFGCYLFWCVVLVSTVGTRSEAALFEDFSLSNKIEETLAETEIVKKTVSDINTRLNALENEISQLIQDMEEGACEGVDETLMLCFRSLDVKLSLILSKIAENSSDDEYIREIVAAIQNRNFKVAEAKLIEFNKTEVTSEVITRSYNNSAMNFDLIVDFAKAIWKCDLSLEILISLDQVLQLNSHDNAKDLIVLVTTLENQVINKENCSNELKSNATDIFDEIIGKIRVSSLSLLVRAMETGPYENNTEVQEVATALAAFKIELSDYVIVTLIERSYGRIEANTILDNISSLQNTSQAIAGISTIYWKVREARNFSSNFMLNLSYNLAQLKNKTDFATLNVVRRQVFYSVVMTMPSCARSLFFSPIVCLESIVRNGSITAQNIQFDVHRRNMFTLPPWVEETPTFEARWYVEKLGDNIFFKSYDFPEEYLYSSDIEAGPEMHHVFGWIPGHNKDKKSAWRIELAEDRCKIKSLYSDEYLFGSDIKHGPSAFELNSYVVTIRAETNSMNSSLNLDWQIKNCPKIG